VTSILPPIDQSLLPQDVRQAPKQVQQQYQAALSFEQQLIGEMTKQLSDTAGSDMQDSPYAQLLPDALTQSITAAGGLGLAREMVDIPSVQAAADATTGTSIATTTGTGATDAEPAEIDASTVGGVSA
jgi:Rod binding domain-containing protein